MKKKLYVTLLLIFLLILAILLLIGINKTIQNRNAADNVALNNSKQGNQATDNNSTLIKMSDKTVTPVTASFTIDNKGIVINKVFSLNFDTDKSMISSVDQTNDYLVNFYITVSTKNNCISKTNKSECYYNLNDINIYSATGTQLVNNRLGSEDYIKPFKTNTIETFGDLPPSFYFQNSNNVSGGFSFILPKGLADTNKKFSLEAKFKNDIISKIEISL